MGKPVDTLFATSTEYRGEWVAYFEDFSGHYHEEFHDGLRDLDYRVVNDTVSAILVEHQLSVPDGPDSY